MNILNRLQQPALPITKDELKEHLEKLTIAYNTGFVDVSSLYLACLKEIETLRSALTRVRELFHPASEKPECNRSILVRWDNSYYGRDFDSNVLGMDRSIPDKLFDTAEFNGKDFELHRRDIDGNQIYIPIRQVLFWCYESDLTALALSSLEHKRETPKEKDPNQLEENP